MQYLQKVVQEVLRLYAIVPFLTRAVGTTTEIKESGVTLKKDQSLMIPMFLMNRDPELWTDPNDFNPDRFEGKGNEFTNARAGFFPFGYGVRTCIGNTLVHVETAVFTALILSRYTIKPAPGFKPIILSGVSLVTSNGINVILEKL
jgi:cytochrome P450